MTVVVKEVAEVEQDTRRDAVEDVRRVPGDQRGAGFAQRVRSRPDVGNRAGGHVRTPVRGDEDRIGVGTADRLFQPVRKPTARQVGERDARALAFGRILDRMIGEAECADPNTSGSQHDWSAGRGEIRSRADARDPAPFEVDERVEERFGSEIERVVVRERYAVDAEVGERIDRGGRRAEVEHPPRRRRAALGDAALQVEDADVGLADRRHDLRSEERRRRCRREPLGDAAAQHRVARERELHAAKPCRPTSGTKRAPVSVAMRERTPSRFVKTTTTSSPPLPIG